MSASTVDLKMSLIDVADIPWLRNTRNAYSNIGYVEQRDTLAKHYIDELQVLLACFYHLLQCDYVYLGFFVDWLVHLAVSRITEDVIDQFS